MNQTSKNDTSTSCCYGGTQQTNICCGTDSSRWAETDEHWITGNVETPVGTVLQVSSSA